MIRIANVTKRNDGEYEGTVDGHNVHTEKAGVGGHNVYSDGTFKGTVYSTNDGNSHVANQLGSYDSEEEAINEAVRSRTNQ